MLTHLKEKCKLVRPLERAPGSVFGDERRTGMIARCEFAWPRVVVLPNSWSRAGQPDGQDRVRRWPEE
jgi:hypothetical protein